MNQWRMSMDFSCWVVVWHCKLMQCSDGSLFALAAMEWPCAARSHSGAELKPSSNAKWQLWLPQDVMVEEFHPTKGTWMMQLLWLCRTWT